MYCLLPMLTEERSLLPDLDSLPTKVWERRLRGAGASPSTPSLEERRRKLAFFIDADDDDIIDVDLSAVDDHGS